MRQNRTNLFLGSFLILIGAWLVISPAGASVQTWIRS